MFAKITIFCILAVFILSCLGCEAEESVRSGRSAITECELQEGIKFILIKPDIFYIDVREDVILEELEKVKQREDIRILDITFIYCKGYIAAVEVYYEDRQCSPDHLKPLRIE